MPRKPKQDDRFEADPDEFRLGGGDVGSIVQLSDKNPPGEPFKPNKFPMGFDLRPKVHRKKHKPWRRVRPAK
jgi:hypothetical protein